MDEREMRAMLAAVADGSLDPDEAALRLKTAPFTDLGYAKVDHQRGMRQGVAEVVYGAGKTPAQMAGIVASMRAAGQERVLVAAAGTSDLPVAEEAALTAEVLGNAVVRLYDVGVAGIHRLLAHADDIASAQVVVAVAGMEGALASVVGGLASCPVIAVPTSVGYGASFGGVAALLAMLNSCASGVSVVNIDNGFGAGYQASAINHLKAK